MARISQVMKVYAELRHTLDPSEYSAAQILQIAQLVVDSYHQSEAEDHAGVVRIGPLSRMSWSVDLAMSDGGWRVLDWERKLGMAFSDDDPIEFQLYRRKRRA